MADFYNTSLALSKMKMLDNKPVCSY